MYLFFSIHLLLVFTYIFKLLHDKKNNNLYFVPIECMYMYSDQPGRPSSQIKDFKLNNGYMRILAFRVKTIIRMNVSYDQAYLSSPDAKPKPLTLSGSCSFIRYEPCRKKTCLWGFRPRPTNWAVQPLKMVSDLTCRI